MKISIVIPVFNENATIEEIVHRLIDVPFKKEIIIVDDGSTDGTGEKLGKIEKYFGFVRVYYHKKNQGKGAALRTGFKNVTGDIVVIQDADLEYDPREYPKLLEPIIDGRADVVYGSRFLNSPHRILSFRHYVSNKLLTLLSNALTNLSISDMETCYKVFKRQVIQKINLKSNRFGFEPEFTVKVAKKRFRICEVPISYAGRGYSDGKKINWKDGVAAIFHLFWFRFFD